MKKAAAAAAIDYVPEESVVGVGTGSTANFFIEALQRLKDSLKGAVASSETTAQRLQALGIRVVDLNSVSDLPVYVDGALIVTEAGGRITGMDGSPFDPGASHLLASNGHVHDAMLTVIRELRDMRARKRTTD